VERKLIYLLSIHGFSGDFYWLWISLSSAGEQANLETTGGVDCDMLFKRLFYGVHRRYPSLLAIYLFETSTTADPLRGTPRRAPKTKKQNY
jgi:hypothetical protein